MKKFALFVVLAACGPSVAIDDGDGTTTDATTSLTGVNPTSATTAMTSASTTVSTTMPSDEGTSVDPTSGSDESSEVGENGETATFIPEPEGSGGSVECDVWAQDCAEGDKCMPWANDGGDAWNATRCSPIDPRAGAIGDPCLAEGSGVSGIDDCGSDAMCWGVDPVTLEGTCAPLCAGSEANPQCADGLTCVIAFEGTIHLCLPSCDPLLPACGESEACMYAGENPSLSRFACLPTPPFVPSAYAEACDGYLQLCASGLACVLPEHVPDCLGVGCCTSVGELSQMPTCPDQGQTCIPFDDTMPDTGLCYCGVPT